MAATEAIPLFRQHFEGCVSFSVEDWNQVVLHIVEKQLKKNQLFAREGEKAKDIAFVLEGNLCPFYSKDGEEKTTYFYFENHLMSSYIS